MLLLDLPVCPLQHRHIHFNTFSSSPVILIINSFSIFSLLERIFNGTADCFVCGEAVAGQGGFSGRSAVVMV
ncbi:MAG: hypothetical protein OXC26_03220, partial [Albidovulum sp.]|nr:hypothetical protein [Albidovulum sp.]